MSNKSRFNKAFALSILLSPALMDTDGKVKLQSSFIRTAYVTTFTKKDNAVFKKTANSFTSLIPKPFVLQAAIISLDRRHILFAIFTILMTTDNNNFVLRAVATLVQILSNVVQISAQLNLPIIALTKMEDLTHLIHHVRILPAAIRHLVDRAIVAPFKIQITQSAGILVQTLMVSVEI